MASRDNTYDVLVIGAGQGGAAVSKRLSDRGIRVICLEQGDWVHPYAHPHALAEWEIEKQRVWNWSPNVRGLPEDYPVTGEALPFMFNAVGGSTIHFLAQWPRLRPVDFRKGTEHGLANTIDWPITYEELAPYYEINDAEVGVAGLVGDPANPERSGRYGPAISPGKLGLKVSSGFESLGWHWWPCDNAVLTKPKDGRAACNACGNCSSGCPRGSMGSANYTYWPAAVRNGVELRTYSRVETLNLDKRGRIDGATYIDMRTGARHKVTAKITVLAANGVGTPRLLFMSAQKAHPDGLANSSGMVGKNLMHHSWGFVDMWFDEPIEGYKGAFGVAVYSQEFYETSAERGFVNGFSLQAGRSYGAAVHAMGSNTLAVAPWGAGHRDHFNRHFGHNLVVSVQGEDLAQERNAVTLDPSVSDSSGLPAAHIEYTLHENDDALVSFGLDRIEELGQAMGAFEMRSSGVLSMPPAWHLMGTCRMGSSPTDSVTNGFNQCWDVPNLFIADGSSLPTGGGVNPTSTIGAIAVRCAEYIADNFSDIVSSRKSTGR